MEYWSKGFSRPKLQHSTLQRSGENLDSCRVGVAKRNPPTHSTMIYFESGFLQPRSHHRICQPIFIFLILFDEISGEKDTHCLLSPPY